MHEAPAPLRERLVAILDADGDMPADHVPEACLSAAERLLRDLLAGKQFGRDSALDLLTVDALMTYAFEHAATAGRSPEDIHHLARSASRMIGQLAVPQ